MGGTDPVSFGDKNVSYSEIPRFAFALLMLPFARA